MATKAVLHACLCITVLEYRVNEFVTDEACLLVLCYADIAINLW